MENKEEILSAIAADEWMMKILCTAETLKLPDWWICAGFVRSKVWDALHGYSKRTPLGDIDVIYYDKNSMDEEIEKRYESQLDLLMPGMPWSVKNQARMHKLNDLHPYLSSVDAISRFPETATALGIKLGARSELELTAPHGLKDLLAMKVQPTPAFKSDERLMKTYRQRIFSKDWTQKWPKLTIDSTKDVL
ncbi:nucleotidyltransferase family protein [Metaplanococcus flavidus]|uniref:Nucleotidyltransferase family protein n=1 Tax=Metaplanococcus flavidus TaxID=569883 RepID=A0ABW3LCL9_9BACL